MSHADPARSAPPLATPLSGDPGRPSAPTTDVVSGASVRLRALATLSGSLTDALDPEEAASLVEQKALTALGANSAVVLTIGTFPPVVGLAPDSADADSLTIVHAIGLSAEAKHSMERLSLSAPVPFAEVARRGEPIYMRTEQDIRRYPVWGAQMADAGARAAAVVPVWANGELRGVLGLTWPEPRVFDEDECAFVLTLGVMCAQAIMRAHLRAAEKSARVVAESANRSKTHFLTMISHELRTPMNAVIGYAQLMTEGIDGPITPSQKDHLERVQASGKHLLGLVEDLLGYARVEAGGDAVHLEEITLSVLIAESLDLVRPLAETKGLRIRVEGGDGAVRILTDARKLRQILVNLLGNAVKFTDAGDVTLLLRIVEGVAEVKIHFEVSDTGPGITQEDQAHVFDAYWRVEPRGSHTLGGTGLGLPVARQLARLLGGDVVIARSEMGHGSTFIVSIPARCTAAVA